MEYSIELQPKQIELYNLIENTNYRWIGYGGSRGGAKSHAIRDIAIMTAIKYPGCNQLIIRRLYDDLLENHIIPLFKKYPAMREYYNKKENIIYVGDSIIRFGYSQYEDELEVKVQGKEYDRIYVDEATHFTEKMFSFLRMANRSKIGIPAKMILTMNPGNVGHMYIKRIFIDKIYKENERAEDYIYLPARVHDNVVWCLPTLLREGYTVEEYYNIWTEDMRRQYTLEKSDYGLNLLSLEPTMRKAHLDGDWDIYGGMFFKTFNLQKQLIKPFEIPNDWYVVGSIDPGYSSPCSFGLQARNHSGMVFRIGTYYESGKNPMENTDGIKRFIETNPFLKGRYPNIFIGPRDLWARKDRYSIAASDVTFGDILSRAGLYFHPAVMDRVPGWWALKSLFPDNYMIFEGWNKELTDEIMAVVSDTKHVEDIQGRGNDPNVSDHAIDEARYGIMSMVNNRVMNEYAMPQSVQSIINKIAYKKINSDIIGSKSSGKQLYDF